jgi:hypothetical protein
MNSAGGTVLAPGSPSQPPTCAVTSQRFPAGLDLGEVI